VGDAEGAATVAVEEGVARAEAPEDAVRVLLADTVSVPVTVGGDEGEGELEGVPLGDADAEGVWVALDVPFPPPPPPPLREGDAQEL
jgi:hypothetical protein